MVLESPRMNVRHCIRVLQPSPGFSAVAVLSLGFGIGANTAPFSTDVVLLTTPALREPEVLVIFQRWGTTLGYGRYRRLRDHTQLLSEEWEHSPKRLSLTGDGRLESGTETRKGYIADMRKRCGYNQEYSPAHADSAPQQNRIVSSNQKV